MKNTNTWRLNNTLLNNQEITEEIKEEINKWDLIKRISFCTAKETRNEKKQQSTDWEKIFANDATEESLISKIYKQLSNKKQPNQKMGRRPK